MKIYIGKIAEKLADNKEQHTILVKKLRKLQAELDQTTDELLMMEDTRDGVKECINDLRDVIVAISSKDDLEVVEDLYQSILSAYKRTSKVEEDDGTITVKFLESVGASKKIIAMYANTSIKDLILSGFAYIVLSKLEAVGNPDNSDFNRLSYLMCALMDLTKTGLIDTVINELTHSTIEKNNEVIATQDAISNIEDEVSEIADLGASGIAKPNKAVSGIKQTADLLIETARNEIKRILNKLGIEDVDRNEWDDDDDEVNDDPNAMQKPDEEDLHNMYYTLPAEINEKVSESTTSWYLREDGSKIENFNPFMGLEIKFLIKDNIAPYEAESIGIWYDGDDNEREPDAVVELGQLKQKFGNRLMRIGIVSDVHYNDTLIDIDPDNYVDDGSEYKDDFENAMKFFQEKEGVDMLMASGDITTDSVRHLLNFKVAKNSYAPDVDFYSCFGNHDFACASYHPGQAPDDSYEDSGLDIEGMDRLEMWNHLMKPESGNYEIHYFNDGKQERDKATYYVEIPIEGTNKSDVFFFLSVDYDYGTSRSTANYTMSESNITGLNEVYEYCGLKPLEGDLTWQNDYNVKFYSNEHLLWLKDLVEKNPSKRFIIFTHQFFPHKAGNNNGNKMYKYAGDSWRISLGSSYCLCGIQFEFLNKLNNDHKNTIIITGHSHYKWNWQMIDPTINLCNYDFEIYRQGDPEMTTSNRYARKLSDGASLGVAYENYNYENCDDTGELIKVTTPSLEQGKYHMSVVAAAACTSWHEVEDEKKLKLEVHKESDDSLVYETELPIMKASVFTYSDIVNMLTYQFDVELESDDKVYCTISSEEGGSNWQVLAITSILNDNGEDATPSDFEVWTLDGRNSTPSNNAFQMRTEGTYQTGKITGTCGYNLHLPSLSRPLGFSDGYMPIGHDSEGAILDIYEDYIDVRGIVFKDQNFSEEHINKYMPLAQYRINLKAKQ